MFHSFPSVSLQAVLGLKLGNQHHRNKSQHRFYLAIKSECDLHSLPPWKEALHPTEAQDIMAPCFGQHPKLLASQAFQSQGCQALVMLGS